MTPVRWQTCRRLWQTSVASPNTFSGAPSDWEDWSCNFKELPYHLPARFRKLLRALRGCESRDRRLCTLHRCTSASCTWPSGLKATGSTTGFNKGESWLLCLLSPFLWSLRLQAAQVVSFQNLLRYFAGKVLCPGQGTSHPETGHFRFYHAFPPNKVENLVETVDLDLALQFAPVALAESTSV